MVGSKKFGYCRSNVSYDVRECLKAASLIEDAGFDGIWDGDHILPWCHTGGHSVNLTVLLTEYLNATRSITIGATVYCPIGIRYQPVDVALIASTMEFFHPGRFALAVGAGEALNEKAATGFWPPPKERVERMEEAVQLIRKCWTSTEYFHHKGKYFNTIFYLYDRPERAVPLIIAANGPKMARIAGKYGDGFVAIISHEVIKNVIIPEFEKGAKEEGKDPENLEKIAFISTSYNPDKKKALELPRLTCGPILPYCYEILDPREIERYALMIRDEIVEETFNIATTADELIEAFDRYFKAGITYLIWDELSPDPGLTPNVFKEKIKPYFDEQYSLNR